MFATDEGYIDEEIMSPVAPTAAGGDPRFPSTHKTLRSVQEREGASVF